jgi:hypothetical protein
MKSSLSIKQIAMTRMGWRLDIRCFMQVLDGWHCLRAYQLHIHTLNGRASVAQITPLSSRHHPCPGASRLTQSPLPKSFTSFTAIQLSLSLSLSVTEPQYIVIDANPEASRRQFFLLNPSHSSLCLIRVRQHSALSHIGIFDSSTPPTRRRISPLKFQFTSTIGPSPSNRHLPTYIYMLHAT